MAISQTERTSARPVPDLPRDGTCCLDWTWTPDGKNFVYVTVGANDKTHLMMQAGGSGHATELQVNIGGMLGLAVPGPGNEIFLQIRRDERGELLKYDTKNDSPLTFLHGVSAIYLAFSRDGQWITYTNSMDNSLWRSRADGSEPLQLTRAPMEAQLSAWSPDGRQIAFMGRQPGRPFRIYLINRDGGVPQEASEGTDNQGAPTWSPDGKELVYGNVFGEETQDGWIRRINLATRKVEIVPGSHNLRTARWSPDGKYVAALRWQARELMLFDHRTGLWRVLADDITGDNISWSGDSQFVYADSPRQKKPLVVRVRVRDGQRVTVVSLASLQKMPGQVQWLGLTPDNSPILLHLYTASEVYALKWMDH
jgi:Tol biopolymer transport system component